MATKYQLTPAAEELAKKLGIKHEPQQMLPKEIFEVLLKDGDLATILSEGGVDLTRSQMKRVKEVAKEQSKEKLEKMAMELANSPGYQAFVTMPIISKILANSTGTPKPQQPAKAEQQKKSTKKSKKKDKDPEISTVTPNTVLDLRKGDSEADILGKMLNLQKQQHDEDQKKYREYNKKRKDIDKERDGELQDLIDAFEGKGKKAKEKPQTKKKKSNLLKYALLGLAAGVGLSTVEKAFASEMKGTLQTFSSDVKDIIKNITGIIDTSRGDYTFDKQIFSEDELSAKESAEEYFGGKISDQEWDQLLRATAAESTTNQKEQAAVMGSILNRARKAGGGTGSIKKVLEAPQQFEAVTGTYDPITKKSTGPSPKYLKGPSEKERQSMLGGAINLLPHVRKDQTDFSAADPNAYKKPGHNIAYRDKLAKTGKIYGGTQFGTTVYDNDVAMEAVTMNKELPELMKKYKPRRSSNVIVNNNTSIVKQGDNNTLIGHSLVDDQPALFEKQFNQTR